MPRRIIAGVRFLDARATVVGHFPARQEVIELAADVTVFLRRQLNQWKSARGYGRRVQGQQGERWAAALGLSRDADLCDRLERWWGTGEVALQEVTRDGGAVLSPARFDEGFDGRFTFLWTTSQAQLQRYARQLQLDPEAEPPRRRGDGSIEGAYGARGRRNRT